MKFKLHQISRYPGLNLLPTISEQRINLQKSVSHRLFSDLGLVQIESDGLFTLHPLLFRSLKKLESIITENLDANDCQRFECSALGQKKIWEQSGRWTKMANAQYRVYDPHLSGTFDEPYSFCLQPTNEESASLFLARASSITAKQLPLKVYQITRKYRSELNARYGLIRAKEFLMKDLYTFDASEADAQSTYNQITDVYKNIFQSLKLPLIRVDAHCGDMGGSVSNEFHLPIPVGQDLIHYCHKCQKGYNSELRFSPECVDTNCELKELRCIEIAHTFLLGQHYSKTFNAKYVPTDGGKSQPLYMGCYGIGLSRLIAAAVDYICNEESHRLVWPKKIAPYTIGVIAPKMTKQQNIAAANFLFDTVESIREQIPSLADDILINDQNSSIGKRCKELTVLGLPYIIIGGRGASTFDVPTIEVIETKSGRTDNLSQAQLFDFIRNVVLQ